MLETIIVVLVVLWLLGLVSSYTMGGFVHILLVIAIVVPCLLALVAGRVDLAQTVTLAFAVAGMAAFFTASIRAPLTGIVICLEMTGCYELFLPMLAACVGSYLVPTLLRSEPIYDALAKPVTT